MTAVVRGSVSTHHGSTTERGSAASHRALTRGTRPDQRQNDQRQKGGGMWGWTAVGQPGTLARVARHQRRARWDGRSSEARQRQPQPRPGRPGPALGRPGSAPPPSVFSRTAPAGVAGGAGKSRAIRPVRSPRGGRARVDGPGWHSVQPRAQARPRFREIQKDQRVFFGRTVFVGLVCDAARCDQRRGRVLGSGTPSDTQSLQWGDHTRRTVSSVTTKGPIDSQNRLKVYRSRLGPQGEDTDVL